MVDPHALHSGHVEVCLQEISIEVRPLILGSDLPPGHVYCLYIPDGTGDGAGVSAGDSALFCIHSAVGLAGRILRVGLQACEPPARFLKQTRPTETLSSSHKRFVFQYYFFGVAWDFFGIFKSR